MGNKTLKNRVQFTSSLSKANHEAIHRLTEATRIPISRLLDEGVEYLTKKYEK